MYINRMPFLTTISKNIKYHTAIWVVDHMAPTISNLVESVLKLYHKAGFQVMEVCTYHEFKPVLHQGGCLNYFSSQEILHRVNLDYKKHCSVPLLRYVLAHDEPTLTNMAWAHALDCLFLHAMHMKQGGNPHSPGHDNDLTSLLFLQHPL